MAVVLGSDITMKEWCITSDDHRRRADEKKSVAFIASGVLGGLAWIKILDKYIGDIDSFIGDIDKIVTYWFWLDRRRFVILITRPGVTIQPIMLF